MRIVSYAAFAASLTLLTSCAASPSLDEQLARKSARRLNRNFTTHNIKNMENYND